MSWKGLKKEGTHERERKSVVGVCCMFGWIVLFVSQVIKLFGRQNKETEEALRERERERERERKKKQSRIVNSTSIFLSSFAFMCEACSQGKIRHREIIMQLGATLEES